MKKRNSRRTFPLSTLLLLLLVLVLGVSVSGLSLAFFRVEDQTHMASLPTEPAEPESPADGLAELTASEDPLDVHCARSYTVGRDQAAQAAARVAARAGKAELTNEALQVYYLAQVASWQDSSAMPDLSRPLDQQLYPDGKRDTSWQQFFLERALRTWQLEQASAYGAAQPQLIQEEEYKPIDTLHEDYIAADLPVNGFLYADKECYTPNSQHQEYLDALPELLEKAAQSLGYAGLEAYASDVCGCSSEHLIAAAKSMNLSYMYYTEMRYDIRPESDDVRNYARRNSQQLLAAGYPEDTLVDFRHILLIPENAKAAEDGTITASQEAWDQCMAGAEKMLADWRADFLTNQDAEANFSRYANNCSQDAGSALNGGLYAGVSMGQLIPTLDLWCFAPQRQHGDTAVLRSDLGVHLVYFKGSSTVMERAAQDILVQETLAKQWADWLKECSLKPDYSAVSLWCDTAAPAITMDQVLYPDVAHERFPDAITYLQQDYMYHPYGGSYVGRGGCGITTFAMLATYMTDEYHTPAMLATKYPQYHTTFGTNGDIFRYIPAEVGFFPDPLSPTPHIDDAIAALKAGKPVVALEQQGVFTSGGHYLLLMEYYEDTDTFRVRDSNVYNYGKLKGHKVDYFTRSDIKSGLSHFYVMQNKIVRIPACSRCGDTFDRRQPLGLLKSPYLCVRCTQAEARRSGYLSFADTLASR